MEINSAAIECAVELKKTFEDKIDITLEEGTNNVKSVAFVQPIDREEEVKALEINVKYGCPIAEMHVSE